jgi:hypothetical protein
MADERAVHAAFEIGRLKVRAVSPTAARLDPSRRCAADA